MRGVKDDVYLIVYPEQEQLREEIRKLKTEHSMLILELDELRFVVCPNIKAAYQLSAGALELRVFDAYCLYLRLKRMIDMIRSRQNRREPVDLQTIEALLDEEFSAYLEQRKQQLREMNKAIERSQAETLSEQDAAALKKLYRTAVKALHPDLHPEQQPEETDLFRKAVSAFQNGDLRLLEVICEVVAGDAARFSAAETTEDLRTERDRLKQKLDAVRRDITEVRQTYPYTLRVYTENEEEMKKLKQRLQEELAAYQRANGALRLQIREMMKHG